MYTSGRILEGACPMEISSCRVSKGSEGGLGGAKAPCVMLFRDPAPTTSQPWGPPVACKSAWASTTPRS